MPARDHAARETENAEEDTENAEDRDAEEGWPRAVLGSFEGLSPLVTKNMPAAEPACSALPKPSLRVGAVARRLEKF